MPLERKILLSILIAIILGFTTYLLYSSYYVSYLDTKGKIIKYQKLIDGIKSQEETVSDYEIDRIKGLIEQYKNMFFTLDESKVTSITPDIKAKLERSGINIKQYENSTSSVRYVINGSKTALLNFLYKISSESKNYKVPIFNIRMIDNQNFQGVIEISKPVLKAEAEPINYRKEIKPIADNPPYYRGALAPMGINFEVPKKEEPKVIEEVVVVEKKRVLRTDKFTFVGTLKADSEKTTLFKERVNGRVFKFKVGETLSGWTYIGERNGKYIMKKDDTEYEVEP